MSWKFWGRKNRDEESSCGDLARKARKLLEEEIRKKEAETNKTLMKIEAKTMVIEELVKRDHSDPIIRESIEKKSAELEMLNRDYKRQKVELDWLWEKYYELLNIERNCESSEEVLERIADIIEKIKEKIPEEQKPPIVIRRQIDESLAEIKAMTDFQVKDIEAEAKEVETKADKLLEEVRRELE